MRKPYIFVAEIVKFLIFYVEIVSTSYTLERRIFTWELRRIVMSKIDRSCLKSCKRLITGREKIVFLSVPTLVTYEL